MKLYGGVRGGKDPRPTIRAISAFVFAVALGMLLWYLYQALEARSIRELIAAHRPNEAVETDANGILESFHDLLAQNGDTIGWLTIDGTNIDYVVMQAPSEQEKYLHRDFYGNYSSWGTLYVAEACDVRASDNIIIYGHHMNDGTMFGALSKFEDPNFCAAHPTVQFDTIYARGTYAIAAVVHTDVSVGSSAFPYYQYTQAGDAAQFAQYKAFLDQNRLFDTGVSIEAGDKLLTLSTCNYHTANGRLIVVCKKVA